eukprot:TRINITY_DN16859_c0_g1_i1.p1 TRINITY_DN16859_c0_g1~~TRINITY_DN16859_c0_g1_i1.p1  ORF type:complete len:201 (-),score=46.54 TRINITY_DN16859_c0_g1_i1:469-1005(-)
MLPLYPSEYVKFQDQLTSVRLRRTDSEHTLKCQKEQGVRLVKAIFMKLLVKELSKFEDFLGFKELASYRRLYRDAPDPLPDPDYLRIEKITWRHNLNGKYRKYMNYSFRGRTHHLVTHNICYERKGVFIVKMKDTLNIHEDDREMWAFIRSPSNPKDRPLIMFYNYNQSGNMPPKTGW